MDQRTEAELNRIRKTHLTALTEADKVFLRARQSYLGKRDQKKYQSILKEKAAAAPKVGRREAKKIKEEEARLAHPAAL